MVLILSPILFLEQRKDYSETVLTFRLRDALFHPNPDMPNSEFDDAFKKITHPEGAPLKTPINLVGSGFRRFAFRSEIY